MSKNKILKNITILLKSRLGKRICVTIFMAVTVIQTIFVVPVYFSYKKERIDDYKRLIRALLKVPVISVPDKTKKIPPTDFLTKVKDILEEGKIEAVAVFTNDGVKIGSEKLTNFVHFRDDFNPQKLGEGPILNMKEKHYGIVWTPEDLKVNFIVVSVSDFTAVSQALTSYLWMFLFLILCVSLSLSFLTLFALQAILIRPILDFHYVLTVKSTNTNSPVDETLDYQRNDELGDIYRAFRAVWEKIKSIMMELQAQHLQLEKANLGMENAIHEKTKNLVQTNMQLQKEIDQHERSRQRIQELTKFPEQNDNPIMRLRDDGRMLYANSGSKELLRIWNVKADMQIPQQWANVVRDVSEIGEIKKYEIQIGQDIYLADFVPIMGTNYVNMYSTNITQHKKTEAELNHVTNHDSITNLPTKGNFRNEVHKSMW